MFDLTTYVKKWRIRQLKTVFSTLDTLCPGALCGLGRVQVPVAQGDLQWERGNAGQHQDLIVNLTCPTIKILGVNRADQCTSGWRLMTLFKRRHLKRVNF